MSEQSEFAVEINKVLDIIKDQMNSVLKRLKEYEEATAITAVATTPKTVRLGDVPGGSIFSVTSMSKDDYVYYVIDDNVNDMLRTYYKNPPIARYRAVLCFDRSLNSGGLFVQYQSKDDMVTIVEMPATTPALQFYTTPSPISSVVWGRRFKLKLDSKYSFVPLLANHQAIKGLAAGTGKVMCVTTGDSGLCIMLKEDTPVYTEISHREFGTMSGEIANAVGQID